MEELESKSNKLFKRLSEIQVKQICRHIDHQISQWYRNQVFLSQPQVEIKTPGVEIKTPAIEINTPGVEIKTEIQQPEVEQLEEIPAKDIITCPLPSNVDIEQQEILPSPQPHEQQTQKSNNSDTIGCFLSNIKHLERYDSDATESTSDNDSYDELEGFSLEDIPPKRPPQLHGQSQAQIEQDGLSTDLKKKSIWKWANERSRLASRWTWLQAQVTDLEFRIRGQNEALTHLRSNKTHSTPKYIPENSCSRALPLSKDFQRRRLIRSQPILADSNQKLVKYSHVPCVCNSLPQTVGSCISCNGRYNYIRQLESENVSMSERISLVDPCCHPVLSLPDDVTLGSQISYLLKQETINRRPTKGRPGRKKGSTAANLAAERANGESNGKFVKGKLYRGMVGRPPGSTKNPSNAMITSNKLRKKYRKHASTTNHNPARRDKRIRRASSMNDDSETSNQYRPRRRRSEQSAYDIDNIVIPFSIAATTRVEVLEYKEILTPSWRVHENGCQTEVNDDETEDISDEAYLVRHTKGETEEKKRFALKPPVDT